MIETCLGGIVVSGYCVQGSGMLEMSGNPYRRDVGMGGKAGRKKLAAAYPAGWLLLLPGVVAYVLSGCNTAQYYRQQADQTSYKITEKKQQEALGKVRPFTIERPSDTLRRRLLLDQELIHVGPASLGTSDLDRIRQWPDDDYLDKPAASQPAQLPWQTDQPVRLTLVDALQIAAHNNRDYQSEKELVFQTALDLDLERDAFRNTWAGVVESLFSSEQGRDIVVDEEGNTEKQAVEGWENTGSLGLARRFENGMAFTGLLGLDLVSLLTQDKTSSRGVYADATISVPLLRGSGRFVVTEPLTQAERDVVYAIYDFERFKRVFAVRIATDYFGVLQQLDRLKNASENYRRLIGATRRASRLADAGRLREIEVDEARQNELRTRNRWVSAQEAYDRSIDSFKVELGLPADAAIELDPEELKRLAEAAGPVLKPTTQPVDSRPQAPPADEAIHLVEPTREGAGRFEMEQGRAIRLALDNRLDLRVAAGRIDDAQRGVAVAADDLRADLTLLGSASLGERRTLSSSDLPNSRLRSREGRYAALLGVDLPLERTAERNAYRNRLIELERAVRDVQELEDEIKLEIRDSLRNLLEARESLRIQAEAVRVAERRVASTDLFLQAGRAEIRFVLEAQEALISAQDALTSALIQYRVTELALQRDLGVLEVDENGLWEEFAPEELADGS